MDTALGAAVSMALVRRLPVGGGSSVLDGAITGTFMGCFRRYSQDSWTLRSAPDRREGSSPGWSARTAAIPVFRRAGRCFCTRVRSDAVGNGRAVAVGATRRDAVQPSQRRLVTGRSPPWRRGPVLPTG